MSQQQITDLLISLVMRLPPELRSGWLWVTAHYDDVGRPILTLMFTVVLLVQVAIVALAVRALMPATRDVNTHTP